MTGREMRLMNRGSVSYWNRMMAAILSAIIVVLSLPIMADAGMADPFETLKFDLGGLGTEPGFIGVSASQGYDAQLGYGFANVDAVEDVTAGGTGELADAVNFIPDGSNHIFNVDLPVGVYKITVTTGNNNSATIVAENIPQVYFMTGNNAVDSFTIPVTDGQLNIYATRGVGDVFAISSIVIEQETTGTTTKPTIWVCGDVTVASKYNIPDEETHGWGQYLANYIDTSVYDVRNISVSEPSSALYYSLFETVEYYGKSGDILILAEGIEDYIEEERAHPNAIDSSTYVSNMTAMVKSGKDRGMTVYLVKQQGILEDSLQYPIPQEKWFSKEIDAIAASEGVGIIDLFHPWLEFCLEKSDKVAVDYYRYNFYPNARGADALAQIVASQLFPAPPVPSDSNSYDLPEFNTASSITYETVVSGGAVANPHKGFVMTAYNPYMISSSYQYGIGGSANNKAWDVVTICSGEPRWEDLNPAPGVYDWTEIDEMLEACEKNGLTYGIRIMPYSPITGSNDNYGAEHNFIPDWVFGPGKAQMVRIQRSDDDNVWVDYPVWDDPYYLQAHKDFVAALAAKYDGDPRVEFIDVRPFGDWGEWHTSSVVENLIPSVAVQEDMIKFYADSFSSTTLAITSDAWGEVYDYALSLGITKRDDGLIATPNREWNLIPAYEANLPVIAENYGPYSSLLKIQPQSPFDHQKWTPTRFRETIEISHMSIYALDQDSECSYVFYKENQALIDEMVNRMGYNFTVTSAKRSGNRLQVTICNTGLAPAYFDINLCAEIVDANGNKIASFGNPVLIESGSFHDETEKTFIFEYTGTLDDNAIICLAMYDKNNQYVAGKDPTIKFDNKNTLSNNRLKLVQNYQVVNFEMNGHGDQITAQQITTGGKVTRPANPSATGYIFVGWYTDKTLKTAYNFNSTVDKNIRLYAKWSVASSPTPSPKPTTKPSATPSPKPAATPKPTATATPTPTAVVTQAPTTVPTNTPQVSTPTPAPVVTEVPESDISKFAERLYTTCLGRASEPAGKLYWIDRLMNGMTGADAAHEFFFSNEFINKNLSDTEFVTRLYRTFMDREPDQGGLDYWLGELKTGKSREFVFDGFINSTEWANVCLKAGILSGGTTNPTITKEPTDATIAFATRLYTTCLCRPADLGGVKYWSTELANMRKSGTEVAYGFFFSKEMMNKKISDAEFINRLYATFMNRNPDQGGFNYWMAQLKKSDRKTVFYQFAACKEFADICTSLGIIR